ncbi:MAG: UDP-glucose 4-epimerase GalE [Stenotrophobium sp.]
MQVLVTGGAGYVGSHACKALAAQGIEPVVYDDLSEGHAWAVQWGPLETGDILDGRRLDQVLAQYRPEAVMHFAAKSSVEESVRDPGLYRRHNVEGTATLLDAMERAGVRRMVFSSSCSVNGAPAIMPIREDAPLLPISPYGETKLQVEKLLAERADASDLRWVALRYFNAAGADPGLDIGEAHLCETHAIPLAILTALGRRPAFRVFGADYDTPDGTAIRDYTHVDDLADAHVKALSYLGRGSPSAVFNLGTGRGVSVRQMIAAVEAASGRRIRVIEAQRRGGDPGMLVADPGKALAILNWRARFQAIEDIVSTALAWHRKYDPAELPVGRVACK